MVAYWVAHSKVNDPEQYEKYADLAPAIIGKFGGKFKILEGPEKFHSFVVIEFPSLERAVARHASAEYQAAAAHRKKDGAGELEIVIVESVQAAFTSRFPGPQANRFYGSCETSCPSDRSARNTNPVALRITDKRALSNPVKPAASMAHARSFSASLGVCSYQSSTGQTPGVACAPPFWPPSWPMKWTG